MWHGRRRSRLSLETEHRLSLIRNLAKELIAHQRVITTHRRAKEAARFTEKLITIAKKKANPLHARRHLISELGNGTEAVAKRLIETVAPKFAERQGGYTRILHYKYRQGDGTQLALLEFTTPIETIEKKPRKAKKNKLEKHVHDEHEHEHKHKAEPKPAKEEKKKQAKGEVKEKDSKEAPKQGGFLKGLRKFLTGKDE